MLSEGARPVRGEPDVYRALSDEAAERRDQFTDLGHYITRITAGAGAGFQGTAAAAFEELIADTAQLVASGATCLDDVAAALRTHADQLEGLVVESDRLVSESDRLVSTVASAIEPLDTAEAARLRRHYAVLAGEEAELNATTSEALRRAGEGIAVSAGHRAWHPDPLQIGTGQTNWLWGWVRRWLGDEPGPFVGDVGGRFTTESRRPFMVDGGDDATRGRNAVIHLLADASDGRQIREDEFQIIEHEPNRYTVVLPGVTDLSNFPLGIGPNRRNGTVRDTDQAAIRSATSTDVADNPYAEAVSEYLRANLPPGSELMLVGHSFGADTAADLAADPDIGDEFNITHVVAVGYDSEPQLRHIPDHTNVLVLQNDRDLLIAAERSGYRANNGAHAVVDAYRDAHAGAIDDAVEHLVEADAQVRAGAWELVEAIGVVAATPQRTLSRMPEIVDDIRRGDGSQLVADTTGLLPDAGVNQPASNQTVVVFSGDGAGAGHRPENYIAELESNSHPDVEAFLVSVTVRGYADPGSSTAVDISVRAETPIPTDLPANYENPAAAD